MNRDLILLHYFRQMVLDDVAMEVAIDPGVSSKDEVTDIPTASRKRAAPKDSGKVCTVISDVPSAFY